MDYMWRVLLLLVFAWLMSAPDALLAAENWVKFASGPFEVWTDGSTRIAREDLVRLEEFRHAVGQIVGDQDLQSPQPIRVLVFKDAKGWATPTPVAQGRDTYAIVLDGKIIPGPAIFGELTRLFLNANTNRMPAAFERGLVAFCSTLQVTGIRITAGTPPALAGAAPDLDWARIHLLVVDPEYYGKLRVLLYNLRKGVEPDAAYRNAFGKSAAEIEAQAKAHLAAGNFTTTTLSSQPLSPNDFTERPVSESDARLARADLLAGGQSAAEYEALIRDHTKVAEAEEGLGLLSLRAHQSAEAKRHLEAAMMAGSTSARCYVEYAKLEQDNDKATQALLRAAGINPKLDEPFALMAARDTDPAKRLSHWKAAAERNPRNASYWQALAEEYLAIHNFEEAAKAWDQAAQAATDPAERDRMRQARAAIEQQRLDFEDAQRRREAADLEKLKQQARAEVHALEEKYREPQAAGTARPADKPVPWWNGPNPSGKLNGSLKQVDCLGARTRLVVEGDDHKTTKLLISDPSKVAIIGGGTQTLGCGAQKARRVTIEYFPKIDSRSATAGEVATIEFQ
jgi:tetratricopeptide (TPR) repeat protein